MKIKYIILIILFSLKNYSQNGSLDTTFGVGGKVITTINNDERANSLVLQSDSKIIVVGYTFSSSSGNDVSCVRYNIDGSLDNSFGINGIATFDIQSGSDDKANSVDIQSDGKIILAGFSDNGSDKSTLLMRLNTNGTIDTTFGLNGKVLTDFVTTGLNIRQDEFRVVKIHQLTGNIIAGGTSFDSSTNSKMIIARYTATGNLDTSFASGGKFMSFPNDAGATNHLEAIEDLAVKSNGKITIAGNYVGYFYLGRLNTNGTLDTTFSSDGVYYTYQGRMYGMELNNDDSFYFTGDIYTAPQTELYTGYIGATGGSISATPFDFGTTKNAFSYAIEKDSNGKLLVCGYLHDTSTGQRAFLLGRLLSNHLADTSFGNGGFITTDFVSNDSRAYDLKIQNDGKIVLAGISGGKIALARYNDGTLSTIDYTNEKPSIKVYPNPTDKYLKLEILNININGLEYKIIDLSGRVLSNGLLNEVGTIDVSELSKGIYVLSINGNDNIQFIKK